MCFAPQRRALFRHFFDIWTSKSGPRPSVFNTFDFKMCFAPKRRALFRHLNFQKWSDHGVLCTFWLQNVLRATTACTFSTSQLPKVVRPWCVLYILTSKCASLKMCKAHHGRTTFGSWDVEKVRAVLARSTFWSQNVQNTPWSDHFWKLRCRKSARRCGAKHILKATTACTFSCLIWPAGSAPAALASLLFDPPEPQIIGKTQWIATFLSFRASTSSFFWSFLFWLFSPLLFNCPYCRKFHF